MKATKKQIIEAKNKSLLRAWRKITVLSNALEMIGKICKSKKHKDPISDILCEVNRAERLQASNVKLTP